MLKTLGLILGLAGTAVAGGGHITGPGGGGSPTGPCGGDLSGTFPNCIVNQSSGAFSVLGTTLAINGNIYTLAQSTIVTQISPSVINGTYTVLSISTSTNVGTPGAISILSDNTAKFHVGQSTLTARAGLLLFSSAPAPGTVFTSTNGSIGVSTFTMAPGVLANNGDQLYVVIIATAVSVSENKTVNVIFNGVQMGGVVNTGAATIVTQAWITKAGPNFQVGVQSEQTTGAANNYKSFTANEAGSLTVSAAIGTVNGEATGITLVSMMVFYYPSQ